MVDVASRRVLVEVPGAVRVRQDAHHDLILLITPTDMTAVGRSGIAWQTEQIAIDDLKVVAIHDDRIVCTGYDGGELPSSFALDPASGRRVAD